VKKVQPEIQRLFDAKEARRRDLARLPFPEKVRLVVELQKMAALVYGARGRNVREWVIE
jgi:hypothetical protein